MKLDTSKLDISTLVDIVDSTYIGIVNCVSRRIKIVGGSERWEYHITHNDEIVGSTANSEIKAWQYAVDKILKESYGS